MKKVPLLYFAISLFIFLGLLSINNGVFLPLAKAQRSASRSENPSEIQFETAIEQVATQVGPSVVSIRTETVKTVKTDGMMFGVPMEDERLKGFFEQFFGQTPEFKQKQQGIGSGLIIEPDGYILTNEHVVINADVVKVTLTNGQEYDGELIGSDPRSDLAVIKIDAENLPTVNLGHSEDLKIGQWVVAIGNPFAHLLPNPEPTVTVGVISALDRTITGPYFSDAVYTALIQTDAAINPGNSGGPLLNLRGDVVGVNVAIFSTSGGYQGVGFAIPINTVRRVTGKIIKGEEVEYGWIGVAIQNLNQGLADYFGLKSVNGVLVHEVLPDGPAAKAGIQKGDIILSINKQKVRNVSELINVVGAISPGSTATLRVFRNGSSTKIKVNVAKNPMINNHQQEKVGQEEAQPPEEIMQQWRGLSVQDIPDSIKSELGLEGIDGVIVSDVEVGTPADDAGIEVGNIIIGVDKKDISNVKEFEQAVRGKKGAVLVRTNQAYMAVEDPEEEVK